MAEADRHDTGAIYKKLTIRELQYLIPGFDWIAYLNQFLPTLVSRDEPVVIYAISYFDKVAQIIAQHDTKVQHNYAIWRLVKHVLPYLDGDYATHRADFRKVLYGISSGKWRGELARFLNTGAIIICV